LAYPVIFYGLIVLLALSASSGLKAKLSTRIWMVIAGFFFIFSFFSRRYLIHLYPLFLVSLAAYISDWWQGQPRMTWLRRKKFLPWLAALAVTLLIAAGGYPAYKAYRQNLLADAQAGQHFEAVAKFMREHIPEGETIFHTNWSDSQYLIGLDPGHIYLVTFDPTYMYYWNPQKYKLYRRISFGSSDDPYTLIKNEFHCRFGYAGKNYFSGLINQIRDDPRFAVMAEDGLGVVFRLR
jgi:hypothetical protein